MLPCRFVGPGKSRCSGEDKFEGRVEDWSTLLIWLLAVPSRERAGMHRRRHTHALEAECRDVATLSVDTRFVPSIELTISRDRDAEIPSGSAVSGWCGERLG